MSSLMSSHGMALAATATAMAVSGTVILMSICRQRPLSASNATAAGAHFHRCGLRPCITSAAERGMERTNSPKKKKNKRVRFGENVVLEFDNEEEEINVMEIENENVGGERYEIREMPANRAALYSGIMQARLQRMACY